MARLTREEWAAICETHGSDVNTWALVDRTVRDEVMKLARGAYQRELLRGHHAWSGSTLTGEQKKWATKYADSRRTLMDRLLESGFVMDWLDTPAGRMVPLVIEGEHRMRWRAIGLKESEIRRLVKVTRRLS